MRPPSRSQSALRTPLNRLLGTEAAVRVLRVLALTAAPLSLAELARRAELRPTTVTGTVARLQAGGLVERLGLGAAPLVRWRDAHPLAAALRSLFAAEAQRLPRLIERMQAVAEALRPPPEALWIEGPVATGLDHAAMPILVRLVAPARDLALLRDRLQSALDEVGRMEDVTLELRAATRADMASARPAERTDANTVLLVFGLPPETILSSAVDGGGAAPAPTERGRLRTHAVADAEALALAARVADRLATDATLLERARARVAGERARASSRHQATLREWDDVLRTMSVPRLRRFLVDRGERATRLRQSMPFLGILSAAERAAARREARGSVSHA